LTSSGHLSLFNCEDPTSTTKTYDVSNFVNAKEVHKLIAFNPDVSDCKIVNIVLVENLPDSYREDKVIVLRVEGEKEI